MVAPSAAMQRITSRFFADERARFKSGGSLAYFSSATTTASDQGAQCPTMHLESID